MICCGLCKAYSSFYFVFQAEDGIRDGHVTGVQTCTLPISQRAIRPDGEVERAGARRGYRELGDGTGVRIDPADLADGDRAFGEPQRTVGAHGDVSGSRPGRRHRVLDNVVAVQVEAPDLVAENLAEPQPAVGAE